MDTGGRYDPAADRWVPTSTVGAPSPRAYNTAVWTGQEMIVFGGLTDGQKSFGDGGRYNPATDVWAAVSLQDAPPPRWYHGAVWTGNEMLLWGGDHRDGRLWRYQPETDRWTIDPAVAKRPALAQFGAVWTGCEMLAWGGALVSPASPSDPDYEPEGPDGTPDATEDFDSVRGAGRCRPPGLRW